MSRKVPMLLCCLLLSSFYSYSQSNLNYKITNWLDNKKAAVTITYDDNCDGQFTIGLPEMEKRNFKSTYYVNSGDGGCNNPTRWDFIKLAMDEGHEIGAHGVNHDNLTEMPVAEAEYQMLGCRDTINKRMGNDKCITFAYPFGAGGTNSPNDDNVRAIAEKYFISARGAGIDYNVGYLSYNAYMNPTYKNFDYQIESYAIEPSTSKVIFSNVLNNAIEGGGWFIPQYHAINGDTERFGTINSGLFIEHMDAMAEKSAFIWAPSYVDAFKYHKEKRTGNLAVASEDNEKWLLTLTDGLPNHLYDHPLTIRMKKPDWMVYSIVQGTTALNFINDGDTLQFNAVPDKGNIILNKTPFVATSKPKNFVKVTHFPNPTATNCNVNFSLPSSMKVKLEIYSSQGSLVTTVIDGVKSQGEHSVLVNAGEFNPGIYFYRLSGDVVSDIQSIVVAK